MRVAAHQAHFFDGILRARDACEPVMPRFGEDRRLPFHDCRAPSRVRPSPDAKGGRTKPLRGMGACGWRSAPNSALRFV